MSAKEKINDQEQQPRSGAYYVIPAQVFEDESLADDDRLVYALISGLCNNLGYCYASDKYLHSKRKGKSEREVKRSLEVLEKVGYIRRETNKNGMFWERKIFLTHARVSNNCYEGTSVSPSKGHGCPFRGDASVPIDNKRSKNKASSSSSPSPKTAPPDPEEEEPSSDEQREIEKRWKESVAYHKANGSKPPTCNEKWRTKTLKDIRKASNISAMAPGSTIEANMAIAKDFQNKSIPGQIKCLVQAFGKYVEISSKGSGHADCIGYSEKDFEAQVLRAIKKRETS